MSIFEKYLNNIINEEINGKLIETGSFAEFKNKLSGFIDLNKRFGNKSITEDFFNELKNCENTLKANKILRKYSLTSKLEISEINKNKINFILKGQ